MAIEANYDPQDSYTADELGETYEPIEDELPEEEEKVSFIRVLREPVVNSIKALPELAIGFVNLLKTPYFHIYVERENTGGNFYGHDPKNPRFVMKNHPCDDKHKIP
jgi:hypothetical protein